MKYHVKAINVSGHALRMTSVRDLRDWSRGVCATYSNVDIKDMSTSFRNGLAFCAIIHKHRPDLIDFSSLSKDNIYQNNKLAFTVAETRLGVSAVLDPKELVSNKVPDGLSIVTYLSQLYCYFNRKSLCAGPAGSSSPQVTVLNNPAKGKTAARSKPLKRVTHLGTDHFSNTRRQMVCNLCFKPVYLIQRHLIDGKFYHLSCFRCRLCRSTLLPQSFKQGIDAGSLICTYHITVKSTCTNSHQFIGSVENHPSNLHTSYLSLSGLSISSVPHYTKKTKAQDEPVCKTPEMEATEKQWRSCEDMETENFESTEDLRRMSTDPPAPHHPAAGDGEETDAEAEEATPIQTNSEMQEQQEVVVKQQSSVDLSTCGEVTQRDDGVDPDPRQLSSSTAIYAVVRKKNVRSAAAGQSSNQHKSSVTPSQSQAVGGSRVKPKHPWMTIVHPGPWTQLPPAPPPVAPFRVKSVVRPRGPWYRTRDVPSNPFSEHLQVKAMSGHQRKPTVTAVCSERNRSHAAESVEPPEKRLDKNDGEGVTDPAAAGGGGAGTVSVEVESENGGTETDPGPHAAPDTGSVHSDGPSTVSPCQSETVCQESPFDATPSMTKSLSLQTLSSEEDTAPEHGFPLVKRKVQKDDSTENMETEMREVGERLEELQQRGVQVEKNLRECQDAEEEEQMLMEWFSLLRERQILVCKDTELVYLTKQQKLEERQADVEYELRCIFNKPEMDWSPEDQSHEQQLMDELVAIITERDQIIGSLELDRQRERQEEDVSNAFMKNKEIQKEGLKEMKKSKGKLNPTNVFKMLNHKVESTRDHREKKS